jgi:hypothetical protein
MSVPAPLSYAQERMWFLNQLDPGNTMYSVVLATRWKGPLDHQALSATVTDILRRHEVLRTRFPLLEEGPVQVVEPPRAFDLAVVDRSRTAPVSRTAEAQAWLRTESRRPFQLVQETPFRAALLRLAPDDHVLALTIHHIAFDRWSRSILRRELGQIYAALAAGQPSPLPEPAIQYREYAERQRERMASDDVVRALAFWRERLKGAPDVLRLPVDGPGRGAGASGAHQAAFEMSERLVEALGALSRRERVTLFMTLLAAFKVLLLRVTGQTDLVVGVPIAGRTRLELTGSIGCFTNTLVLRTDASGNPAFRELLGRVREVALTGYAHQELPFEHLVRELRPERHLGRHPVFQVLFNYVDFPTEPVAIPGVELEELEVRSETALLDLDMDIRRVDRRLLCTFICNGDLFQEGTVARLARQYQELLETVARDADSPVTLCGKPSQDLGAAPSDLAELEDMSDEEAERLLAGELRSGGK